MESTGERFLPEIEGAHIAYEHWHRYLLASSFVKDRTVLDVASGEGYGSNLLASYATSVVGVDIEPDAIRHAAATYPRPNLRFLCGPAEEIPIAGLHLFDMVVSFETLEHLCPEAQRHFLKEIKRLLRPGGLLMISTPNRLIYSEQNGHQNPYHQHEFNRGEFVSFLGEFFPRVQILSQRVYPGSYIWNIDQSTRVCVEYQLGLVSGRLQPVPEDGKEQLYYVAVRSQDGAYTVPNSVLLDLNETAIHGTRDRMSTLFVDSGAGFRSEEAHQLRFEKPARFQLEFHLTSPTPVRALQWDPVEMRTCRVCLTAISWQDDVGRIHGLDLANVTSNGISEGNAVFRFETFDPMLFFPVHGRVRRLTIEGSCEVDDVTTSMRCMEDLAQSSCARFQAQERQLQELKGRWVQGQHQVAALKAQVASLENQLGAATQDQRTARVAMQQCEEDRARLTRHIAYYDAERTAFLSEMQAMGDDRAQLIAQLAGYETERARFAACLRAAEQVRLRHAVDLEAAIERARRAEGGGGEVSAAGESPHLASRRVGHPRSVPTGPPGS
jgi:SAM-dependent methyltransferase